MVSTSLGKSLVLLQLQERFGTGLQWLWFQLLTSRCGWVFFREYHSHTGNIWAQRTFWKVPQEGFKILKPVRRISKDVLFFIVLGDLEGFSSSRLPTFKDDAVSSFVPNQSPVNGPIGFTKGLGIYGFRIDYQCDIARNAHCAA